MTQELNRQNTHIIELSALTLLNTITVQGSKLQNFSNIIVATLGSFQVTNHNS